MTSAPGRPDDPAPAAGDPGAHRAAEALRHARLRAAQWDEVRRALDTGDATELHRLAFEARVQRRAGNLARSPLAGKGSPKALVVAGGVSTVILVAVAWSLGGGLLFIPALIPAAMIAMVFVARWANNRRVLAARAQATTVAGSSGAIAAPADVRSRLDG